MDFWSECPDEVLITIFKNFDLKTQLQANQTCRRWYELLKDPRARMDDVSEIFFRINADIKRWKKKLLQNTLEDIIKNAMEGLSNHVGKAEKFNLVEADPIILSLISKLIDDGLLKIDKFLLCIDEKDDDFSITDWIKAILPSSIRELDLYHERKKKILICDWSLLPQLQRLTLTNISIDLSATSSPPLLKYLKMEFFKENDEEANVLDTTLSYLPQLEELRISDLNFDDRSFRNFLITIRDKLPNLRRLYFSEVTLYLSDMTAISNEFKYGFTLDSLKEIEFLVDDDLDDDCPWNSNSNSMDFAKLFSRICPSAIIHFPIRLSPVTIMTEYDDLTALTARGNTKLALKINFSDSDYYNNDDSDLSNDEFKYGMQNFESLDTPPEFGQALVNLRVKEMKSTIFLKNFFNCNSYEKLTKIDFCDCDGLNDEILKIVAQSCPCLKNMSISDCKRMTENGLKSFLIYWEKRQSKRLSITINQYDPPINIDRLFGTSFEEGRGILDERWTMEEENENDGSSSSKKQKMSMENGKRWILYRKTFKAHRCDDLGIRLVIWDQENSLNNSDQKVLVIKNNYSLPNNSVDVNPI